MPDVVSQTGLGRSTVYAYSASGRFPSPIQLGPGTSGWLESEVSDWIAQRVAARDQQPVAA